MNLTFSQAYDIVEKAFYWNRSNPDFNYSPIRKPYMIAIAVGALCEHINDFTPETRSKFVSIFIESVKTYELTDSKSKSEIEFNEDAFRNYLLNDFTRIQNDLEFYFEEEYNYIEFLLEGIKSKN